MADGQRERQTWAEWLRDRKADPESAVNQLIGEGLSLDAAVIVVVLGKIHEELIEMQEERPVPGDEWMMGSDD